MRFSEILLVATTLSGIVWALDTVFLKPRRMMYVLSDSKVDFGKEPWWVEYAKSFFPILFIVFILRSFVAEPFRIPSGSMHPTLWEGDFIVVNKYSYGVKLPLLGYKILEVGDPKRGDVVVFKHDKEAESMDMIKRIIGLPNDHIQYKDKILYVNGEAVKQVFLEEKLDINTSGATHPVREFEEALGPKKHKIYVHPTITQSGPVYNFEDVIVPAGHYFVMGDNRDNSKDSRMWGFVSDQEVQGRAFAIWLSWDSLQHRVRWDRLATKIE